MIAASMCPKDVAAEAAGWQAGDHPARQERSQGSGYFVFSDTSCFSAEEVCWTSVYTTWRRNTLVVEGAVRSATAAIAAATASRVSSANSSRPRERRLGARPSTGG